MTSETLEEERPDHNMGVDELSHVVSDNGDLTVGGAETTRMDRTERDKVAESTLQTIVVAKRRPMSWEAPPQG